MFVPLEWLANKPFEGLIVDPFACLYGRSLTYEFHGIDFHTFNERVHDERQHGSLQILPGPVILERSSRSPCERPRSWR